MPQAKNPPPFEAYEGTEQYVFACYSHLDSPIVFSELVRIKDWGVNIWYDEGIDPGNEWPEEIAKAIDGASLFLCFLSPNSAASIHCRNEVNYARNANKRFLCIQILDTDLSRGGIALQIGSLQAIPKWNIPAETYERKLKKSLLEFVKLTELPQAANSLGFSKPFEVIARTRLRMMTLWIILAGSTLVLLIGHWINFAPSKQAESDVHDLKYDVPALLFEPDKYSTEPRLPDDMLETAQQAANAFKAKDYNLAAAKYQIIIKKYPDCLYAWSNLGVVRFQQGDLQGASDALNQAIKFNPADAFSYANLGIVYYQLGHYDQAIDILNTAKSLDPNDAKIRNYLACAASQKGLEEVAKKELQKAIELDPAFGDAHFNLALVFATETPPDLTSAEEEYKKALALSVTKDKSLEKLIYR